MSLFLSRNSNRIETFRYHRGRNVTYRKCPYYASVNPSCAKPTSPPSPPPHRDDPRALLFFCLGWQISGMGTLELSNPPGWGQKKGANAPSSVNAATFLMVAQSNSAVLNILMCDFLFQVTSSFVIALGF